MTAGSSSTSRSRAPAAAAGDRPASRPGGSPLKPEKTRRKKALASGLIPGDRDDAEVSVGGRSVKLTNLRKVFWPKLGITKGDLLRYYAEVSDVLLPHIRGRAMVLK